MRSLKLSDGGRLNYQDQGTGRPIVLLHGWGMQAKFFDQQISVLAQNFRIVAPDLRGHGRSTPIAEGQGFATLVDDVTELLAALDLSNTLLIGWSMGAMVAWGVLRGTEATRITALVTIDMAPRLLNDASWKFGLRDGADSSVFSPVAQRMVDDWPEFTRIFVPRIFARGRQAECRLLAEQIASETKHNDPESMKRLWMSMADQDFRDQLSKIEIPTLVTYGALSQLYTEAANEWVADQMPNAKRVVFANSGHAPHLEEPDCFNREIEKFADQTARVVGGKILDASSESE